MGIDRPDPEKPLLLTMIERSRWVDIIEFEYKIILEVFGCFNFIIISRVKKIEKTLEQAANRYLFDCLLWE